MNAVAQLKTTVNLFWTAEALQEFQQAWDNDEINNIDADWVVKIYRQNIVFKNPKIDQAVDADVEKLFKAARTGCNLTLNREHQKLRDKWAKKQNDQACDYLATAWDCISTVQCKLAARWGADIHWSDTNE